MHTSEYQSGQFSRRRMRPQPPVKHVY